MSFQSKFAEFRALVLLLVTVATVTIPTVPLRAQQSASPAVDTASASADPPADDSTESMLPHLKSTRFWLSGQANFVFQAHPDFQAPYSGTHSLSPDYEKATSRVVTLYTGVRLNNSTGLLVGIEA